MDSLDILHILQYHTGHKNAIKGIEIARILGYTDDRQVRLIIRELIKKHPIASSVTNPQGYFMIETRQEALDYQETLKGRLIEDAKRLRDFKRSAGLKGDRVMQRRLL